MPSSSLANLPARDERIEKRRAVPWHVSGTHPNRTQLEPTPAAPSEEAVAWCSARVPPGIWNTAREMFPQAIQILDRYHVKKTLHRTAQAIFGALHSENQDSKLESVFSRATPDYQVDSPPLSVGPSLREWLR